MLVCFDWGLINIQHYISFWYMTQWVDICIYSKMITTINPVNICLHTWLKFCLFLWWGLLNISVSNFQTCNTELLTTEIMLYIKFLWLTYFKTGSLYSLTICHSPILPILHCLFQATTNLFSVPISLFLSYFVYKWDHIVFVFLWHFN